MKISIYRPVLWLAFVAAIAGSRMRTVEAEPDFRGKIFTFTYAQNFDGSDAPSRDLDFHGIPAESDPAEMQTSLRQIGT